MRCYEINKLQLYPWINTNDGVISVGTGGPDGKLIRRTVVSGSTMTVSRISYTAQITARGRERIVDPDGNVLDMRGDCTGVRTMRPVHMHMYGMLLTSPTGSCGTDAMVMIRDHSWFRGSWQLITYAAAVEFIAADKAYNEARVVNRDNADDACLKLPAGITVLAAGACARGITVGGPEYLVVMPVGTQAVIHRTGELNGATPMKLVENLGGEIKLSTPPELSIV